MSTWLTQAQGLSTRGASVSRLSLEMTSRVPPSTHPLGRSWENGAQRYDLTLASTGTHRRSQFTEKRQRLIPTDAGVCDALSVGQWFALLQFLCAANQIAFDHRTDDSPLAAGNLCGDIVADHGLPGVVFVVLA